MIQAIITHTQPIASMDSHACRYLSFSKLYSAGGTLISLTRPHGHNGNRVLLFKNNLYA